MARPKKNAESLIKDIKRKTRRKFSSEEKIRIVIQGLKGESSVAQICRQEGISPALYYRWSKDFMEAGKRRLQGDTTREANSTEVNVLRNQSRDLKEAVAELLLENRMLKKSLNGTK
jgi:transposase